jgi:Putative peptidoglycan binding domain
VDLGPIKATADEQKTIPLPPILGASPSPAASRCSSARGVLDDQRPLTPMRRGYLLGAIGLAAGGSGILLYMVATRTNQLMNDAAAQVSGDRQLMDSSTTYREQMKLAQETLRSFGYAPGAIDGIIRFETASALRAFQREQGLQVTGHANPETLAALGIEDKLSRRPR